MLYPLGTSPVLIARPQLGSILVYNQSAGTVYIGRTSAVSPTTGTPLSSGGSIVLNAREWWAVNNGQPEIQTLYVEQSASSLALPPPIQMIPSSAFGNGTSTVVIESGQVSTLDGDLDVGTLNIKAGGSLFTAGFNLRCAGMATINGLLHANGGPGNNAQGGSSSWGVGAPLNPGMPGVNAFGAGKVGVSVAPNVTVPAGYTLISGGSGGAAAPTSGYIGGSGSGAPAGWYPTISNLSSFIFGGGASGGVNADVQAGVSSGAGGGVLVLFAAALAGTGTIAANAGASYCATSTPDAVTGAGGSGGGVVLILTNDSQAWLGTLQALGAPGAGSGLPGFDGPAYLLSPS